MKISGTLFCLVLLVKFQAFYGWNLSCNQSSYTTAPEISNKPEKFKSKSCVIQKDYLDTFQAPSVDGDLHQIIIKSSEYDKVPNVIFQSFPNLMDLEVHGSKIVTLKQEYFKGAACLKKLTISDSHIVNLTDSTFMDMGMLEHLNLSHNSIQDVEVGTFHGLEKLKVIDLSQNTISKLNETVFNHLYSLEDVYLNNNQLEQIPSNLFIDNPNVKRLNFENNQIEIISFLVIKDKFKLKYFNMKNNICANQTFVINDFMRDVKTLEDELVICLAGHPIIPLIDEKKKKYQKNVEHLADTWRGYILKLAKI